MSAEQETSGYPEIFPWHGAFVVPDVQRQGWWPHRPVEGRVDSLWFLGDDAAAVGAFGRMIEATDGMWVAADTSVAFPGTEPVSWSTRHVGWVQEAIGEITVRVGDGVRAHTEWWRVASDPENIAAFVQGPLVHPGMGAWLGWCPPGADPERFVHATLGIAWWRSRQQKVHAGPVAEVIDEGVKEALLGLVPQLGFVSVVALNRHPVAGAVLFGEPDTISSLAHSAGVSLVSSQGAEASALLERGTWLATG